MQEFAYIHEQGKLPKGLENIPFLEPFNQEQVDELLHSASLLDCDPEDLIIREGEKESRIFILLSGEVSVIKNDKVIAKIDRQGAIFGEIAAISDDIRSASVRASSKVICLAIDQKFLRDMKPHKEDPLFYAALYKAIAQIAASRLKTASEELVRLEHEVNDLRAACRRS